MSEYLGERSEPYTHDHQFYINAVESAIATIHKPLLPAELSDCPVSSGSSVGVGVSVDDICNVDAVYGSPKPSIRSCAPSVSSLGSSLDSLTSPSLSIAALDISDTEDQPSVPYDPNHASGSLPCEASPTVSSVEESPLKRIFCSARNAILTVDTAPHRRPSRDYKLSHHKHVSSTSRSVRRCDIGPYGKPRNFQSRFDALHFAVNSTGNGVLHCPVPCCDYVQAGLTSGAIPRLVALSRTRSAGYAAGCHGTDSCLRD